MVFLSLNMSVFLIPIVLHIIEITLILVTKYDTITYYYQISQKKIRAREP